MASAVINLAGTVHCWRSDATHRTIAVTSEVFGAWPTVSWIKPMVAFLALPCPFRVIAAAPSTIFPLLTPLVALGIATPRFPVSSAACSDFSTPAEAARAFYVPVGQSTADVARSTFVK